MAPSELRPVRLQCEYRVDPLGIDERVPRLSWALESEGRGQVQSAYRILAGTHANCAGGRTPWGTWLSGEEHEGGMIWEADPSGALPQMPRDELVWRMHFMFGTLAYTLAATDTVQLIAGCKPEDRHDARLRRVHRGQPFQRVVDVLLRPVVKRPLRCVEEHPLYVTLHLPAMPETAKPSNV